MHIDIGAIPDDGTVSVVLPMPPDHRFTFSGSALPFPSENSAFEPSQAMAVITGVNRTRVDLDGLAAPNWYYRGGRLAPPRARVQYRAHNKPVHELVVIQRAPRTPFRSLTPPLRRLESNRHHPVLSQEVHLRARGMPGHACP
jgi:hypothetical protein